MMNIDGEFATRCSSILRTATSHRGTGKRPALTRGIRCQSRGIAAPGHYRTPGAQGWPLERGVARTGVRARRVSHLKQLTPSAGH